MSINELEKDTVTAMENLAVAQKNHKDSYEAVSKAYNNCVKANDRYKAALIASGCYKPQCKYHEDVMCENQHQCVKSECELAPDISLV